MDSVPKFSTFGLTLNYPHLAYPKLSILASNSSTIAKFENLFAVKRSSQHRREFHNSEITGHKPVAGSLSAGLLFLSQGRAS
jgi:hypothetical protein